MSDDDRARWDRVWAERGAIGAPAAFLVEHEALLPRAGRALDVAGGNGRHAVWLARRGLDVTIVDVSEIGLAQAVAAAPRLRALRLDLEREPLPTGPFEIVLCVHYLDRANRDSYVTRLAPGGLLIMAQPTIRNRERHERPSERFLVAEGELAAWARGHGLELLVAREGWTAEGRHEAALIARVAPSP